MPIFAPTLFLSPRHLLTALLLTACSVLPGRAQVITTVTTLHSFNAGVDGDAPLGPLTEGSDGNFYGTTSFGGPGYLGTIFRLTPSGVFTVLHTFAPGPADSAGPDGASPEGALFQTSDGTFYGTTAGYTSVDLDNGTTTGSIFKITPDGTFTVLFNAYGSPGGLVQGTDGALYGTTPSNANLFGGVFKITPDGILTTLHEFTDGSDGGNPTAGLLLASDGNFYGTTAGYDYSAGTLTMNYGTVFRIGPAGDFATVYRFTDGGDGAYPGTTLVQGRDGALYGTTPRGGGGTRYGTIYKLTLDGVLTTLHTFTGGIDGADANTLLLASDGNFYGTASYGGANDLGTIFQMTPDGTVTTLYSFTNGGVGGEGNAPPAALIQGSDGSLYGVANGGGTTNGGTVFKVTFGSAPSTFFTGQVSVGDNVYYLSFPSGNFFGFYAFLSDPHYIYHVDLGYEYVIDANDGNSGVYLYDFASNGFFYTSPSFPFPYLYDFKLGAFLYYYPDPPNPGRYNKNGVRFFYDFSTNQIISK